MCVKGCKCKPVYWHQPLQVSWHPPNHKPRRRWRQMLPLKSSI